MYIMYLCVCVCVCVYAQRPAVAAAVRDAAREIKADNGLWIKQLLSHE
jgi:hypothetical protein